MTNPNTNREEQIVEKFKERIDKLDNHTKNAIRGMEIYMVRAVLESVREVDGHDGDDESSSMPGCLSRVKNVAGVTLLILIGIFIMTLFIPDSGNEPAATDLEPTAIVATVTQSPTNTVIPPTNTPEATATHENTEYERLYVRMVRSTGQSIGGSMGQIGTLLGELADDESLLYSDEYRIELAASIANVEIQSEKILEYEPVPARFEAFHEGYSRVAELLLEAMDEVVYGIDNVDVDAINRATELMEEALEILNGLPIEDLGGIQ